MADHNSSDNYRSDDETARDTELEQIMLRRDDVERRAAALDTEWERFTAAVAGWAKEYGLAESPPALLLRLLLLPPHLHQSEPSPSPKGAGYSRLESAATSLLARRRAMEAELVALHEDFHDWARSYGVELVSEEVEIQMSLTEPMRLALPPELRPCFGNSWRCRRRESDDTWVEIIICCRIR